MRRRNAEMADVQPSIREFKYENLEEWMKTPFYQYEKDYIRKYFPQDMTNWRVINLNYHNPILHNYALELAKHSYAYVFLRKHFGSPTMDCILYSDFSQDVYNLTTTVDFSGVFILICISDDIIKHIFKYSNIQYLELLDSTLIKLKNTKKLTFWTIPSNYPVFTRPKPAKLQITPPNKFIMKTIIRYSEFYNQWQYYYVQTCPEDEPLLKSLEKYDLTCKVDQGWWIYCSKDHLRYLQSFDYLDEDEKRKAVLAKLLLEFIVDDLIVIPGEEGEPDQIVTSEEGCQQKN